MRVFDVINIISEVVAWVTMALLLIAIFSTCGCVGYSVAHKIQQGETVIEQSAESYSPVWSPPAKPVLASPIVPDGEITPGANSWDEPKGVEPPSAASKAEYLVYILGAGFIALAVVLAYLVGYKAGLVVGIGGVAMIAVGKILLSGPWIYILAGIAAFVGVGWLAWNQYRDNIDKRIVYGVVSKQPVAEQTRLRQQLKTEADSVGQKDGFKKRVEKFKKRFKID